MTTTRRSSRLGACLALLLCACGGSTAGAPDADPAEVDTAAGDEDAAGHLDAADTPPGAEDAEPTAQDASPAPEDAPVTETTEGPTGWFTTGQDAAVLLGAVDFNESGGAGLFNHPKGIATDGQRLLMADGNNNRVLLWTSLPTGDVPADLVLGQPDMDSNDSGEGATEMKLSLIHI